MTRLSDIRERNENSEAVEYLLWEVTRLQNALRKVIEVRAERDKVLSVATSALNELDAERDSSPTQAAGMMLPIRAVIVVNR